jgi:hypothetical protein
LNLNRPIFTLRVIIIVKHIDRLMPSASGQITTSGEAVKEGRQSSAYARGRALPHRTRQP